MVLRFFNTMQRYKKTRKKFIIKNKFLFLQKNKFHSFKIKKL